jgi:YfiR/HmsC-like
MRRRSAWRTLRKLSATFLLVSIVLAGAPRTWAQENTPGEYQVKAAFLLNFAKFVDWPAGSFASPESPFLICVIGGDPFGHVLDDYMLGQQIGDRTVQIARFPDLRYLTQSRSCQIVFLSASIGRHSRKAIDNFRGTHALLVGDTPGFATSGGAIEFTLKKNHVRFTINPDAAKRAGLRMSSKLLSLAKIVHDPISRS